MAQINLLPWRDERRAELKQEFLVMLGAVALLWLMALCLALTLTRSPSPRWLLISASLVLLAIAAGAWTIKFFDPAAFDRVIDTLAGGLGTYVIAEISESQASYIPAIDTMIAASLLAIFTTALIRLWDSAKGSK